VVSRKLNSLDTVGSFDRCMLDGIDKYFKLDIIILLEMDFILWGFDEKNDEIFCVNWLFCENGT
jgi:hypothetical protein